MAEPENGNGRATVALVAAMVSEVRATVVAGFADVQRQLDDLRALPERVAKVETRVSTLEKERIEDKAERDAERAAVARRLGLTIAGSSLFVAGVAVAANFLTGH